jgi:O-antigen ligase
MKKILEILRMFAVILIGIFIASMIPVLVASHYECTWYFLLYIVTFPVGIKILFNEAEKPLWDEVFGSTDLI